MQNIVILNSGLIDSKVFASSLLEFIDQKDINNAILVVREKVIPESRSTEIVNILQYNILITSHNRQYPSLNSSQKQIVPNKNSEIKPGFSKNPYDFEEAKIETKNYEKTLKENIEMLNSELITAKELGMAFIEMVPHHDFNYAFNLLRKNIKNMN